MKTRCLGCMEELDRFYGRCPKCGYELDSRAESPIHMQPGTILKGRFVIGKVLGFGGFGVTYIGWDDVLRRKVAIKEYLPSEFATRMIGHTQISVLEGNKEEQFGDGLERFVEEAKRLARFQNEDGIVKIYDSFSENNTAYIIMEYLEGETLTSYLQRNGKIAADDAVEMLLPVLESLETIHQAGIIHRDIAPDNIFLTKGGEIKLIDFGAARHATTSHSRSLTVIVKPGYSPEEQYRSKGNQGPHTDVYAIAAVLYRMITGVVLPDSMERSAFLEDKGKDIVLPISKCCEIDKSQENAIMNALNIYAEDRTATAAKFIDELTSGKRVVRVKQRVGNSLRSRGRKTPMWLKFSVAMLAVFLVGLVSVLFLKGTGQNGNLDKEVVLKENEVRVIGIVNYSVDVAQSYLSEKGIGCQIIGAEYTEVIPAEVVLYQNVAAGRVVEKNSVIDVYVSTDKASSGLEPGIMPYVVYKTEAEAVEMLEAMGLFVTVERTYDELIAQGLVVAQSIEYGTDTKGTGAVLLEVSEGINQNKPKPSETVIVLSRTSYNLYAGDSVVLQAEGGDGKYSFSSGDETVAVVDESGRVTAKKAGKTAITVKSGKAEDVTCMIQVKDYEMKLNPNELKVFVDKTGTLVPGGIPNLDNIVWVSGDEEIATVDETGLVTGKKVGKTIVTATWKNDDNTYTAEALVEVQREGITLSTYKINSLYMGETYTIGVDTSEEENVNWKSSDEKVAKVDSKGVVTAVGSGKATITVSVGEFKESCSVTVVQPAVSLTKSSISLLKGSTATLSAKASPSSATVTWSSDNEKVVKVNQGKITAVGNGKATVYVSISFAGKTYKDSCTVKVGNPSITISQNNLTLSPGESKQLTVQTVPAGNSVSWKSSNNSVATVSGGVVKAVSHGTAQITAHFTYEGKTYKATCNVTVNAPSISLVSSASTIEFSERDKGVCTLTAKVSPDGGTVKWSINDSNIATISGNGKQATVTAKSQGTVTITAMYSISGITLKDTCTIDVKRAASTLKLENVWYPESGTCDSFRIQGKVTSNYAITRMECTGTCTSNALGITLSDTAKPLYIPSGTYSYDLSEATSYFIEQYRALYDLYETAAGLLGADNSVTMRITGTCYDSSGNKVVFNCTYVIYGD